MKTGIYVPLVTPFKENGEIDYEVLAKATKFVLSKGADGIYACGGTAEFCLLTTEERKRCLEVIIENADGKEVIAHVGSQSTAESVECRREYAFSRRALLFRLHFPADQGVFPQDRARDRSFTYDLQRGASAYIFA